MAGFTAIEAQKLLDDEKITDKEIKRLVSLRNGALGKDVEDEDDFAGLKAMGLVQIIPLTHPRSTLSIPAYIPSEAGVTLLNEIDKRYRENADRATRANANTPTNVEEETVRTPVDGDRAVAVANADTKKAANKIKKEEK